MRSISNIIINEEIINLILVENKDQLDVSSKLIDKIIPRILTHFNNLSGDNKEENTINQSVFVLYSQIIMTYKSTLLLLVNGYFTNALVNMRNLYDSFFNMKYICQGNYMKQLNKAEKYLKYPDKGWTESSVKDRALKVHEDNLLKIYDILCNYSHGNYMGTGQQFDGAKISIEPNTEKIRTTMINLNSVFVYCTEFLLNRYNFEIDEFSMILEEKEIKASLEIISYAKLFKSQLRIIFGEDWNEDELELFFNDYINSRSNK